MSKKNLFSWFKKRIRGDDDEFMINRSEHIEPMTAHYLSIIDQGLDLYDFKPEPPTGAMATNMYAIQAYSRQVAAFSRAMVILSKREMETDSDE